MRGRPFGRPARCALSGGSRGAGRLSMTSARTGDSSASRLDCTRLGTVHLTSPERQRRDPPEDPLAGASGWYGPDSRAGGVCNAKVRRSREPDGAYLYPGTLDSYHPASRKDRRQVFRQITTDHAGGTEDGRLEG